MSISGIARWVEPCAQPDGVDTIPFQNGEEILLDAACIVKGVAVGLHLWQPANVSTLDKCCRLCWRGSKGTSQRKCANSSRRTLQQCSTANIVLLCAHLVIGVSFCELHLHCRVLS